MKNDRRRRPKDKGPKGLQNRWHRPRKTFGDGVMRGNNEGGSAHPESQQVSRKDRPADDRVYLKFLLEEERHHGFLWRTGRNVSPRFSNGGNPGACDGPGLYFCTVEGADQWIDYRFHRWVRRVHPDPASMGPLYGGKGKAKTVMAEERMDLLEASTWEWVASLSSARLSLLDNALYRFATTHPGLMGSLLQRHGGTLMGLLSYLQGCGMSEERRRSLCERIKGQVTLKDWRNCRMVHTGLRLNRPGPLHLLKRLGHLSTSLYRGLHTSNEQMINCLGSYSRG